MSAEVFLDTNIFVYCFDAQRPEKQAAAKKIVSDQDWFVSWQVVEEFSSVALHRFQVPIKPADLAECVEFRLWPSCRVLPSQTLFQQATEILLSEDLQDGQRIGSLEIRNPFKNLP